MKGGKSIAEAIAKVRKRAKEQKAKGHSVAVGITDPAIATYAAYNEFGWVQAVTPKQQAYFTPQLGEYAPRAGNSLVSPPRPFMHATFVAKHERWTKIAKKAPKVLGITDTEKLLSLLGQEAVSDIKQTIKNAGTEGQSFAPRAPMTMALHESQTAGKKTDGTGGASGSKPLTLSGRMIGSIHYEIEK